MPQLDWDATINTIRESLPQTQFQNWFKPLTLIRCDERSVVLGVPSRFHEDWVRSHYSAQISTAIRKQCGADLQLEFEVMVEEENLEAAASPAFQAQAVQRPNLRVLDGGGDHEVEAPVYAEPPSLPPVNQAFVELDFNRMAYQCTLLLAEGRVPTNPLILMAGVGMGKTHLLTELGMRVYRADRRARVRYTNAESFTAEMVHGIKTDGTLKFKKKYREETDLLLFDDLHGLSRRLKTQEELLHMFNEIVARGGSVAFTTLVAPNRLEDFIEPLKSRLLSGIIAEVKPPTYEEKIALLTRVCEKNHIALDPLVLSALADKSNNDVRELIGTLLRVHLQANLEQKTLDASYLAQEGFRKEKTQEAVTLDEIIGLVEHNFAVPRTELMSKSRKSLTTWARQVAMYLARHYTLLPLEEIGKTFGRDHATVIHAFQKVTETMESHPTRRYEVDFLKQKLQSRSARGPEGNDAPFL